MKLEFNFIGKNNVKNQLVSVNKLNAKEKSEVIFNLENKELDVIVHANITLGADEIALEFMKFADLKEVKNVEKALVENRKKVMELVVKSYTKTCIDQDILEPNNQIKEDYKQIKTINYVFNMVNNYYDSLYARFTDFDETKTLPEYEKKELDKLQYESYKKIKENTGIAGINQKFKKVKGISFAEFCRNTANEYMRKFNNNVEEAAKKQIEEEKEADEVDDSEYDYSTTKSELDAVDIRKLGLEPVNIANINRKIPTMYGMLKRNYESRSTAERFFSYFPFINPTAKEERRTLSAIEMLMEKACHFNIDEVDLDLLQHNAMGKNANAFYDKELSSLNYIDEVEKQNIIVENADLIDDSNIGEFVEEIQANKNLIV